MSLISDALKTAQRERASQAKAAKGSQPVSEGFFPYVSSAPTRARSKRTPIIVVSSVVAVIIIGTAWLMRSALIKPPSVTKPPIILPPPVTVTQAPKVPDTAAVAAATRDPATATSDAPSNNATNDAPTPISKSPGRTSSSRSRAQGVVVAATLTDSGARVVESAPAARAPTSSGAVQSARVDYEAEATALFNAGDLAGARDRFQLATRFAPTARAWTNYGVTLQRLGDFAGAASAYQAAIGVDANYLEAWLYQGRLAADRGDIANAVPLFQRARAINPRSAEVNVELARLEYDSGNFTEAKRFAEEAARSDPANTRANWYIGVASDTLKDAASAIRGFTAYLQYIGAAERDQAQFVGWARQRLAALRGKP